MPKNSIYVHTQTKENYKRDKKITTKQWRIFYYLLSVSKYNAVKNEDHRYVYKKDFNISACCRFLGVKSNQTFYNAIKSLEQKGLVIDDGEHFLLYAREQIDINQQVLINFVKCSAGKEKENNIDLLRTFLILKKINKIAGCAEEKSFTARQIILLLGHNDTENEQYSKIKLYLALLSFWGLIELKVHTAYNEKIGRYTVYHLQSVQDIPNNTFNEDIEAEKNAPLPSEEIMAKLYFQFPEIMN